GPDAHDLARVEVDDLARCAGARVCDWDAHGRPYSTRDPTAADVRRRAPASHPSRWLRPQERRATLVWTWRALATRLPRPAGRAAVSMGRAARLPFGDPWRRRGLRPRAVRCPRIPAPRTTSTSRPPSIRRRPRTCGRS